ncbi:MAG: preprotein translocase subunit SecA [Myxococcales bacterium]
MFNPVKLIVGTSNQRHLRKIAPLVARINELETKMRALPDEEFPKRTAELKQQVQEHGRPLDEVLPEAFALCREASRRVTGMRHFDVQLVGGSVLHEGRIAEMKTGEGKTLVATLPSYLNALAGRGVHVVTVNDYLAKRDAEWMGRIHGFLGMRVGVIVHGLTDKERQHNYRADITYGQNNEFGFDYLRDNMKFRLQDYVQRELNYAIVDEVDSILIDEARTPLIISGPAEESTDKYYKINQVIPGLVLDQDYTLDEEARSSMLTDEGVEKLEKRLGIQNLYDPEEIETLHHVEQGLRAHTLYKRDRDYVVRDGEVLIVDEFTGRILPGRRWSDGLHQAIEAKEGVKIENENQTLATISFQNYFRMYSKLSGMTGTADTEAGEFHDIYKLGVTVIPTNKPMIRKDLEDVVYKTEREKFKAVAAELKELNEKGQPVLVGTVSIAKSEVVSNLLKKQGIPHNVLNAKQHEKEAHIVAQAGRKGSITISTNMAGRGTDIILGGNPEVLARAEVGPPPEPPDPDAIVPDGQPKPTPLELQEAHQRALVEYEQKYAAAVERHKAACTAEREEVLALGGLFILGTERHESRRIDNQLRGRAGRQGDPGMSRFYLSLEDDLMRIFGSDRISGLMETLGMQEDEQIEHRWLTRAIEGAQKKVEGHNFDIRKNLLEYDDVMNQQRKTIYALRREVLAAGAAEPLIEYIEKDEQTRVKERLVRHISWSDQREKVVSMVEDVILDDILAATCPPGKSPEAWDLPRLKDMVKEQFGLEINFGEKLPADTDELAEQIFAMAEKAYKAKEEQFGEDAFRRLEQYIYLNVIDTLWKDHLLAMDHLRQGIGLRGYGQKDPKVEYKKEGYDMFQMMTARIRGAVVGNLLRVQPRAADNAAELERQAAARRQQQRVIETHGTAEQAAAAKPQTVAREGPKVGRNDPCPCGSGKKYKKCHGMTNNLPAP